MNSTTTSRRPPSPPHRPRAARTDTSAPRGGSEDRRAANQAAQERAGHLNRYIVITAESMETREELRIGAALNEAEDGYVYQGLNHLSAAMQCPCPRDDCRRHIKLALHLFALAAGTDRLERAAVYQRAPEHIDTAISTSREGAAATEAGR